MRAFLSIPLLLAFAAVADARPPQATIHVRVAPQSTLAVAAAVPVTVAPPVVLVPAAACAPGS